ncbi:hypothetical protein [Proteiniborus sp. MB09-C3]|uniref:hypothetical protein n=1 Tax=Proteiniborus sp. MB09-C3 TaxID=3050072 RepID=UPI002557B01A|nr:hypothetical protein [Proteiniborus sp. MB09-C3]WIV10589.1 hypothetical protein QO263_10510 [Proteiniborus sp. MB09-C3]
MAFTSVGCSKNDLTDYVKAVKKTYEIKKGTSKADVQFNTEFNFNSSGTFEKELYDLLRNAKFSMNIKIDKEADIMLSEMYVNLGRVGQDINFYSLNDRQYIEYLSTVIEDKKYIELTKNSNNSDSDNQISENTLNMIKDKWTEILKEENVFKGNKVLVSTDEGEVKATEYTIEINNEQFKELAGFVIDAVIESDDINKLYNNSWKLEDSGEISFDNEDLKKTIQEIRKIINESSNSKLLYKAFMDMDGYIVEENIEFILETDEDQEEYIIKKINVQCNTKNFNIQKEQNIDFEKPTPENTIKIEDVDFQKIFISIQGRRFR